MEEKKLVPKRRFKGFEGEWFEEKLGNIYVFKNGLNKGKEYFGIGTPIINYMDVYRKRSLKSNDIKGRVLVDDKELINFNIIKGDILFTRTSETLKEIGYPAVVQETPLKTVFSGFLIRARAISNDPINNLFKSYVFFTKNFRLEMVRKSSMTTRALTSGSALSNMVFYYANSKKEQQKIGEFFKLLDQRIENQERKIAKVKALKTAYLSEMFPQEGETVPRRRFEGFEGKWVIIKIKELGEIYQPITIAANKLKGGKYKVFGANGYIGYHNLYNHKHLQVTVSCRGENSGKANLVEPFTWITGNSMVINTDLNTKIDKLFLYYFLSCQDLRYLITGSGQPQITRVDLGMHEVLIPSLKEQEKIGTFFKTLDSQIETEERKLEKLKQMKEAYLEEMFV